MVGVGVFVVWLGYLVVFYGVDQIRGGNNGLLDLALPSRMTKIDAGPNDPDAPVPASPSQLAPNTQVIPPTPGALVPPSQGGTGGQGWHSKADSIPTKKIKTGGAHGS